MDLSKKELFTLRELLLRDLSDIPMDNNLDDSSYVKKLLELLNQVEQKLFELD